MSTAACGKNVNIAFNQKYAGFCFKGSKLWVNNKISFLSPQPFKYLEKN